MIDALAAERDEAIDQRNASDFVLALALKMSERRSAERDAHRDAHAAAQNVLNALYCERDRLREALREIVEAWDWWQQDTSDRCQSVPSEAIARARAALGDPGHD